MIRTRARRLLLAPVAVLLAVSVVGCSGDDDTPAADEPTPEEVLAEAQATLDDTSGLSINLTTPGLPDGVQGIAGATGVITSAPAFEGELEVVLAGTTFTVPVIAVDESVYAQLPLTQGYQDIDPAEYNAPDPAGLVTGDAGFPTLLPATTDVVKGDSVRGGANNEEVLTTYTGTVPGDAMKKVIPSSAGDSFTAKYQITDDGELREATFTGAFYPDSEDMTYTVTFEDYGTEKEITAP